MGAVADQHQVPLFRSGDFDTADDFTEEGIANIRHNHQDRARFVAFHISPERLRQIADFQRRLLHPITGSL
jgi:hypothetical protein